MFGEYSRNRKRTPKAPKAIPMGWKEDTPKSNVYCWICYTNKTNLRCTKCPRHFHAACVKSHSEAQWICNACKETDSKPFAIKFIPNILDSMENQFTSLKKVRFNNEQSQYPIDISQMKRKSYETFEQFENDIKWFEHNCRTVYPREQQIQNSSKRLIEHVKEQIKQIELCKGCYENACTSKFNENSLVLPCSQPHLVIWMKYILDRCYRPAKVMGVDVEKNLIHVHFFGENARKISRCAANDSDKFLYSKTHPDGKLGFSYAKAIEEANEYINNIERKFGAYNFAKHCDIFEPEKLQDHLKQMITTKQSTDSEKNVFNASGSGSNHMHSTPKVGEFVNKMNRNSMPKRSASNSSSDGAHAKKIRVENEMDSNRTNVNPQFDKTELQSCTSNYLQEQKLRIDKASAGVAQELQAYTQIFSDNIKMIEKLQKDKSTLVEENYALKRMVDDSKGKKKISDDEKKDYVEKCIALKNALKIEKETFESEKKTLMNNIAALEMEKNHLYNEKKKSVAEKAALEKKVEELELKQTRIMQLIQPFQ